MKTLLTIISSLFFAFSVFSQCSVTSTNGYTVNLAFQPTSLVLAKDVPPCLYGYSYNVMVKYSILFTGNNIPSDLTTLNGNLICGSSSYNSISFPTSGGTGSSTTTGSPYSNGTDCATATVSSLMCNTLNINIQGPGINYQTITCPVSILPVTFERVSVKRSGVFSLIEWATLSETNNQFFEIERSPEGEVWYPIGRINPKKDEQERKDYAFEDKTPLNGLNYYRIKQVDFDGKSSYSQVKSIEMDLDVKTIALYPNPVHNIFYTRSIMSENKSISIFNVLGKNVSELITTLNEDNYTTKINVTDLPNGIYMININGIATRFQKI